MVNSPFFMIVGLDDLRRHEFVFQTTPEPQVPAGEPPSLEQPEKD